ncbi:hypothetical protein [[Mycobacterium] nativiensis]|uniref:Uncharacterized protein n=1 Tax=[Mycobacterium] nativiensis TaxID=2855503 RepID=A0ABU5Y2Z9_9MYCO|nr:hypothetical protein [Mycolicibacter sp. MYC340]MEB3034563.1 hypothetical protein [Mycolicibacter sp. MYC340]
MTAADQLDRITEAASLWRCNDPASGPAMVGLGSFADMQTALRLAGATSVGGPGQ